MKYNPPYGSADPNAPYVDRNTPGAVSGSRVPAAAIEHPQREIMAVIAAAGLSGSGEDLTQLLQAIQQIVAQITGGGDTENFVTYPVAQARLPIYPEVLTEDGRLPIVSPSAGQVRVPAAYDFLHRGIRLVTTVQQDFATVANKTYHVRWTAAEGFQLRDLADVSYNPTAKAEADQAFDSTFDDILFARVVTNGSNVPTVTNLANKAALRSSYEGTATPSAYDANFAYKAEYSVPVNWARTPFAAWNSHVYSGGGDFDVHGGSNRVYEETASRYLLTHKVFSDWDGAQTVLSSRAHALMIA